MSSNMYTSIHGVTSVTVGEISQLPGGQWVREVAIEAGDGPILVLNLFGRHEVEIAEEVDHAEV